jgi:hypothetical protein
MPDVRATRAEGVRYHLAQARGLARAELARAQALVRAARAALAQAREAADEVPRHAAIDRDTRLAQIDARHRRTLADLTDRAAEAAEKEAPGLAGAPWDSWRLSTVDRVGAPKLVRIGEVRVGAHPPVPALVPLLDRAHVALTGQPDARLDQVLTTLLLRALGGTAPGRVRLTGYDPERLGGGLAGFAPLAATGLLTFVGPGGLGAMLDGLVEDIRRINETVLAGDYPSLGALAAANRGWRPEPWRVAVLLGEGGELSRHERAQLDRVVRTGVACGVHVIARGIALPDSPQVETIAVAGDRATATGCATLPIRLDPPPPPDLVGRVSRLVAEEVAAGPPPALFANLMPEKLWTESSAEALVAPVGDGTDGRPVEVLLGDHPPHALIGGPSGSGKTNFIYAWLGALAARYSPDELELYLLDFKEGVSFARFAPGQRDPSWLPHVRLVGINVNTDREFGLALLRFLGAELRRRAEAAKRAEATKLAELRADDPTGHWPRIMAVVDEFQVLVAGRDALANEAVTLLEDLARRGRSQGIHLVLASQEVSGIEALWGRPALVAQFSLRIALPKARRILVEKNPAADEIPRYHAVVNPESGSPVANRIVRVPESSSRQNWDELQRKLWRKRAADLPPPRLFDGEAVPRLEWAPDLAALRPSAEPPVALLGEAVDVAARSGRLPLGRVPGRNLAVLGTRGAEACAILGAAARSLARQGGRFSVAYLDDDAAAEAAALREWLPAGTPIVARDAVVELLAQTAAGLDASTGPHYVILYAVDAAADRLSVKRPGGSGHEHLRRILHGGPERHTHILGWWRGVSRLRDDLGGVGARFDAIGAWVALDVHGPDLAPLSPQPGGPTWYPRPWRALFFDRAVHRTAEVIIPYEL